MVELGDAIEPQVNARAHALHASLVAVSPPGLIESVPAYVSLTLYHDPATLPRADLQRIIGERLAALPTHVGPAGQTHIIPVSYGGEDGPDLDSVAAETGLTAAQVTAEHAAGSYRVYLVGFSPGFPYLGLTPERLQVKRLATPRTRVPAGSVALAGRQTGIYPAATPGGWRLIGRTGWRFFNPARQPPARLQPGDLVRFVARRPRPRPQ